MGSPQGSDAGCGGQSQGLVFPIVHGLPSLAEKQSGRCAGGTFRGCRSVTDPRVTSQGPRSEFWKGQGSACRGRRGQCFWDWRTCWGPLPHTAEGSRALGLSSQGCTLVFPSSSTLPPENFHTHLVNVPTRGSPTEPAPWHLPDDFYQTLPGHGGQTAQGVAAQNDGGQVPGSPQGCPRSSAGKHPDGLASHCNAGWEGHHVSRRGCHPARAQREVPTPAGCRPVPRACDVGPPHASGRVPAAPASLPVPAADTTRASQTQHCSIADGVEHVSPHLEPPCSSVRGASSDL